MPKNQGVSIRDEMPLTTIQEVEVFYCWRIDFVGPFPSSFSNEYILVRVDYVSKLVEEIPCMKSDANGEVSKEKHFLIVWHS
jgi:hypothetical protein